MLLAKIGSLSTSCAYEDKVVMFKNVSKLLKKFNSSDVVWS